MTASIVMEPIGIIHTPFKETRGMPIQPVFAKGAEGRVEIYPQYQTGLKDLDGFDRIWLVYSFHRASGPRLCVVPYLDDCERGVFATRAPCRPNPIGMSPVRLLEVRENVMRVGDIDVLDGTPLLDIKPYARRFDCFEVRRSGWLDHASSSQKEADDRFSRDV
ncbi:MAG: tRNA (N6-threonylcarbamoyladenosine(37)-N6)-methyltransferase TrmO [Phycisphaerae bacterium]|nr:tRNA (N6-threonylcarbamoyladenosine(37)-N6)-methyltransferase TrmO [Phycisphaerae bacterium]